MGKLGMVQGKFLMNLTEKKPQEEMFVMNKAILRSFIWSFQYQLNLWVVMNHWNYSIKEKEGEVRDFSKVMNWMH